MKGRLEKFGIAFLALALALTLTGAAFAAWTDDLTITGTVTTGELDWEFYNPQNPGAEPKLTCEDQGPDPQQSPGQNTEGKDVASTTAVFSDTDADGDYDRMSLTIDNAYPYYYNHCAFWVHCNGNIPLIIERVNFVVDNTVVASLTKSGEVQLDLGGTSDPDISIYWGDNFGAQLHYCDRADMSFDFYVLQEAPQGQSLTFSIEIVGIQWNEYSP